MKLLIFNGSNKLKSSNSGVFIDQFLVGFKKVLPAEDVPIHNLRQTKNIELAARLFSANDTILFFIPLYFDCMPACTKILFEEIKLARCENKKIGFIIHSAFPESLHSKFLADYLKSFTKKIHADLIGIVIKGGSEGMQVLNDNDTKKTYKLFRQLGNYFAHNSSFCPVITEKLMAPHKLSLKNLNDSKIVLKNMLSINKIHKKIIKENNNEAFHKNRPYI